MGLQRCTMGRFRQTSCGADRVVQRATSGGGPQVASVQAEWQLQVLRRHARDSTAFQTLEPGLKIHRLDDEAFAAFHDTGAAWVVVGTPVGPIEKQADYVAALRRRAQEVHRRLRFVSVPPEWADACGLGSIVVGEEPYWMRGEFARALTGSRSLREQLRRARAKGVTARCVSSSDLAQDPELRRALVELGEAWLRTHRSAPLGFMVHLELFAHAEERLYVVAERAGEVTGLLAAIPAHGEAGWMVEDLLRTPDTPNGTVELMIAHAMDALEAQEAKWVSLGLAPLAGPVSPLLAFVRRRANWFYNFDGLIRFKAKFKPTRWEARAVAYPPGAQWLALFDVLSAFARDGVLRFALATLWRYRKLSIAIALALGVLAAACIASP